MKHLKLYEEYSEGKEHIFTEKQKRVLVSKITDKLEYDYSDYEDTGMSNQKEAKLRDARSIIDDVLIPWEISYDEAINFLESHFFRGDDLSFLGLADLFSRKALIEYLEENKYFYIDKDLFNIGHYYDGIGVRVTIDGSGFEMYISEKDQVKTLLLKYAEDAPDWDPGAED